STGTIPHPGIDQQRSGLERVRFSLHRDVHIRYVAVFNLLACRSNPLGASFRGCNHVEVVEAPEEVALRRKAFNRKRSKLRPRDGPRLQQQRLQHLDPEDSDGFVIARSRSVLAPYRFVIATHTRAHMIDRRSLPKPMNIAGPGEQMRSMRPALLRQRARFEGSKKLIDLNFG